MKKIIKTILLILLAITAQSQIYIGTSITPTLNKDLGLQKSIIGISAEFEIPSNTSFFVSGSIEKIKVGFIFGNSIQFSCAYVQYVGKEVNNNIELGFRYKIKTKNQDFIEIGSYLEVEPTKEASLSFIPLSIGYKKCI